MLRAGGRELIICEHRSSDPARVTPVFSPNSRRVFFGSDRHGKPAIYSMDVGELVEATEREA
jgi:oligogalacturonide lyase